MRILHITKKYPFAVGGDATVVSNLQKNQESNNHIVYILTNNCEEIKNDQKVIKIGLKETSKSLDSITLSRIFTLMILFLQSFIIFYRIKPDIIHSHSPDMGFVASFGARLYKIPIIHTCHGISSNDRQYSLFKRYSELLFLKYGNFKRIMVLDKKALVFLHSKGLEQAIYFPNGVDLSIFLYKKRKFTKITKLIFVGRLEKQKGIDYLLNALKNIQQENHKIKAYIVGNGNEKKNLIKQSNQLGLKNVSFIGEKNPDQILKLYYLSDIFILPSIWEGMPITLLEAWATGLACIGTDVGGIRDVGENGSNLLKVKPKNSDELTKAIKSLLNNNLLRLSLGNKGRKTVEKNYSLNNVTKNLQNVYNEVII